MIAPTPSWWRAADLGVEMPTERVATIQTPILRTVRAAGEPVVTATQMLANVTETPAPTRAEDSDAAPRTS